MLNLLICLGAMVLLLVAFDGAMAYVTGETCKGNTIISGFITILMLYAVIMGIMGSGTSIGFISDGIPFVSCMDKNTTLISILHNDPLLFAKETAELISLCLLISFIEKILPTNNVNVPMMIISRVILVMVGVIVNCVVTSFVCKNQIYKWALVALQSVLAGTTVIVTPAVFVGNLLHVNPNNKALTYALKQLSGTAIGKSFSAALSRSAVLLIGLMILESQIGPLSGMMDFGIQLVNAIAPIIVSCIGLSILLKSMFK